MTVQREPPEQREPLTYEEGYRDAQYYIDRGWATRHEADPENFHNGHTPYCQAFCATIAAYLDAMDN